MVVAALDEAAAAAELRRALGTEPFAAALVLGSGLGGLAAAVADARSLPFTRVTGMPPSGVPGHEGRWVAGGLEGRRVLVQAGRYHLYEGHAPEVVRGPVRIAAALGARILIVTNAAGGIRRSLTPGTLMLLEDHLDLIAGSPLDERAGPSGGAAESPYDPALRELAASCARTVGVELQRGVYAALTGPSYETPAEIRMLARLGADAVGMSTVPEVAAARALGLRCLGLSLVTNHAAGIVSVPLAHADVLAAGLEAAPRLERLLRALVRALPE